MNLPNPMGAFMITASHGQTSRGPPARPGFTCWTIIVRLPFIETEAFKPVRIYKSFWNKRPVKAMLTKDGKLRKRLLELKEEINISQKQTPLQIA